MFDLAELKAQLKSWIAKKLPEDWWKILESLLPKQIEGARHSREHRMGMTGTVWCLGDGTAWRDVSSAFGPWETVNKSFARWTRSGFWQLLIKTLQARAEASEKVDWSLFCVDGTNVRASRAAVGAPTSKKKNEEQTRMDQGLGRSRGGYGSKLHLITDGKGLPLGSLVTAGQAHESRFFEMSMNLVQIRRLKLRARERPKALAADKAYDVARIRSWLRKTGTKAVIPRKKKTAHHTQRRKGRPPRLATELYRRRNVVELCCGWLKENRRVATPYDKYLSHYHAMVQLAMLKRYLVALLKQSGFEKQCLVDCQRVLVHSKLEFLRKTNPYQPCTANDGLVTHGAEAQRRRRLGP